MTLLSQQNRSSEIQLLSSVVALIGILVSCACFTIGICQRDSLYRRSLIATSFCSLLGASASRRIVRITEDYNQKISDLSEQAEEDAIYTQANMALPSSNRNNFNVRTTLRNANLSENQNDIYIGW
jgi:hypothetical protein